MLLHLLLLLILFALMKNSSPALRTTIRFVPVAIVHLGENTISPPQLLRAAAPQQKAPARKLFRRSIPVALAPARKLTAPDTMDAQLRTLAKLHEPQTNLPVLDNAGESNIDATSNDAAMGARAAYRVKDYIRNQVERRWSLNLSRIGDRNYVVLINIKLKRNGAITKAEIVDKARFASDIAYRDVALSARNAVLLSSPIALPAGQLQTPMDMTLRLDPRDTLH
ncbi:MAG TPA: hypothetical protein VII49_12110 [Rhizomicrobium sp.]